jgi:hypothetical protein
MANKGLAVDDVEDAEAAIVDELIAHEIDRPALHRPLRWSAPAGVVHQLV